MKLDSGNMFVTQPKIDQPIDIVLPTHNKIELTITCIESLYENTAAPFNLIVVDDSTDKLTSIYFRDLQKRVKNLHYIYSRKPFKEGNEYLNLAFSYAKYPYIACVGNSIRVEPDWEMVALNMFAETPDLGIVGFKNLFTFEPPGYGVIESAGITMVGYTPVDIGRNLPGHRQTAIYGCPAVQWAFCMVRKEAVTTDGIGDMPTDVYNGFRGWDDIDNCFVLKKRGWKVLYCGYGAGYHFPRATRGSNAQLHMKENHENARRFYKRWGYWEHFIKEYPKAPDGTDWPESVDGVVNMKGVTDEKRKPGETPESISQDK